ncbi:MAG TPA: multiheme c-type cytochrome [bacterium]|nr:multiheme c-type cytochrome [bacterium]
MRRPLIASIVVVVLCLATAVAWADDSCVQCHRGVTPGQVMDWESSRHHKMGIGCDTCHGADHTGADDAHLAALPDEHVCAECHEEQFEQFSRGKHNFGWTSMNALPVTHLEPDALIEGGKGCGGCHNMGIKSEAQKADQLEKGYRYQNNSCDECHTRHAFSKKEALNPRACQQCHMGFDHPQWEMWESSKHGTRYFAKLAGDLPEGAAAPTCAYCHLPNGTHENRTAWGFLGVRLPMPEDEQWTADRATILKALGVLHPDTGEPTALVDVVAAADLARLTEEAWQTEREKMVATCSNCHSESYARTQLETGDELLKDADRLMAQAIDIVAGLYADGIIQQHDGYPYAYPNFLFFNQTGGNNMDDLSYVEQVLLEMYLKHRMRTFQGSFHASPDYAYWYGWAQMTKDLGEIQELARAMRATHAGGTH